MKETFIYTLQAILPILFIILLGYVVRRIGPWPDDFYKTVNQLCFRLFLPIHLFCNIYSVESLSEMNWKVIGFILFGIILCLVLGVAVSHVFVLDRRQKGVITQATFRSNQAILGLPLANALGGEAAMAFASLTTSVCVPLFNFLGVITLTVFSGDSGRKISIRSLCRRVVTNPLIIGCVSGMVFVIIRQFLPTIEGVPIFSLRNQLPSLYQALTALSKVASPMMLFVLGTRLNFASVPGLLPQLLLGTLMRLFLCPVIVLGLAVLLREPLGLTTMEMPTLIAVSSTPVAVSSAVMVQEIGGDDHLASQLVVWSSVLSLFTVFCIVWLLRTVGLL